MDNIATYITYPSKSIQIDSENIFWRDNRKKYTNLVFPPPAFQYSSHKFEGFFGWKFPSLKMRTSSWWGLVHPRELYELDTEADAQAGWEGMDSGSFSNAWEFFCIFWLPRNFFLKTKIDLYNIYIYIICICYI